MILEGTINQHGPIVRVSLRGPDGSTLDGDALIDTGAAHTIVCTKMAQQLGAPVIGTRKAMGACGECDMPKVAIGLKVSTLPWELKELYASPGMDKKRFVMAIGWDFLKQGKLTTDGPRRRWSFVVVPRSP